MIDFRIQILIALAGLYFINKILTGFAEKTGLAKTKEEKEQEKEIANAENSDYWKPSYYKDLKAKYKNRVALSNPETVERLAKNFYDAIGTFNDNEDKVYANLRFMKYGTQLSQVSERFFQMYQKDLFNYLRSSLNDKEMTTVSKLVNNLETGILK